MYWYVGRWLERYTCVLVRGQMVGTLHLCIGTRADGRSGTPVYWYVDRWKERCTCCFFGFLVGSRDDGNAPVERMCSERRSGSAL